MKTENKAKIKTAQWRLQKYKDEIEKAKQQIAYLEELINKEQNYITYLTAMKGN